MKLKNPKVSVLMPAYNSEKYIAESIESILNQTFDDFEFIIINDGSTDNTPKIVKEYAKKDSRIRFIDNKKNQGLVAVLNQGLDLSNGEYIARMDSDDISLPDRLEKQVDYMEKHQDVGVLSGHYQKFGAKETIVMLPEHLKIIELANCCSVCHPLVMLRKSVIDKYHFRYDPDFNYAEDYDLWSKMIQVTKIDNLQEVLLKYRVHNTSISIKHNKKQKDLSEIIKDRLINSLTDDEMVKLKLSPKYNQYLFGFIPWLRIKRKRIYLFCFIPLLKLRGMWWYLFDFIPFVKNSGCKK